MNNFQVDYIEVGHSYHGKTVIPLIYIRCSFEHLAHLYTNIPIVARVVMDNGKRKVCYNDFPISFELDLRDSLLNYVSSYILENISAEDLQNDLKSSIIAHLIRQKHDLEREIIRKQEKLTLMCEQVSKFISNYNLDFSTLEVVVPEEMAEFI